MSSEAVLKWAARGRSRGYDTPESILEGLRQCIVHTQTHLALRKRKGYRDAYEDQAVADIEAIAAAIVLIEKQCSGNVITEDDNEQH